MASLNSGYNDMQRVISDALGAHWKLFLFQGVIMLILGVLAVAAPAIATMAVDIYVGWLFMFSGIVGLVAIFSARNIPAFLWSLLTAALSVVVGVLLVWKPVEGALSLTLVLTAFFVVEGIFQIVASVGYRDVMRGSWGWMLVSGIADLVLAAIIILGWPTTAVWALGLIVGINLLTSGWAIVMAALAGRGVAQAVLAPAAAHH
ncbi:MAG TPA: HdeD family acid-resistance protein [Casimicrobiaceae bacterium]|nr:HdeD family acid-resistance protein [Casimicrobiaceae bacterium]